MGWELRDGNRYYYRSRRVGGRSIKEYVGRGPIADLVAQQDADRRELWLQDVRRLRQERDRTTYADALSRDFESACRALASAELYLNGYHEHSRGWRRRRVGSQRGPG